MLLALLPHLCIFVPKSLATRVVSLDIVKASSVYEVRVAMDQPTPTVFSRPTVKHYDSKSRQQINYLF